MSTQYDRDTLLRVLESYATMIDRDKMQHPTAVLSDIRTSIGYVISQARRDNK